MKKQIKVSIIVPIYKVEKYLVQCIDSIINQTLKDIEIILVNEGDKDACRYIIDHYEQTDNRVVAIHKKNGGYGASVNNGIDIARGEYIGIVESDDFIKAEMFEELYKYAHKLNADVVKSPYYEYYEKDKNRPESINDCHWRRWTLKVPQDKLFSLKDHPVFVSFHASLWSAIYKTSYLRKHSIRFLEIKGGAYVDHSFRTEALMNTKKIAWLDKPFYFYRLSNELSTTNSFNLSAMIKRWNDGRKLLSAKYSDYIKVPGIRYALLRDEFCCIYDKILFLNYKISETDYNLLLENLNNITEDDINNIYDLLPEHKHILKKIKSNPKLLKRFLNKPKKNKKIKWYACNASFYLNKITIHLLKYMRHNIFRLKIRLGETYTLDICLGKVK